MAADACDICYSIVGSVFNEEAVLPGCCGRAKRGACSRMPDCAGSIRDISCCCRVRRLSCFMRRIERVLRNLSFGAQYIARGVA